MNTGIIASRYAKALLMLVDETGGGEAVVGQVRLIRRALESVPELRRAMVDSTAVTAERKTELLETVVTGLGSSTASTGSATAPTGSPVLDLVEGPGLAPELRKLIELLVRNGRIGDISLVLSSFEKQYYESQGIVHGRLVLSGPKDSAAGDLERRLKDLIESKTGKRLFLETQTDESLIGGFVLEVEDRLLDASVSHQLDLIRNQFVEKNRRIV